MGALPESEIRDFLKPHLPVPAADPLAEAEARLARGDLAGARARAQKALAERPDDAKAHVLLAKVAFQEGNEVALERHALALPEGSEEAKAVATLPGGARLQEGLRREGSEWRRRLAADPADLEARYALACCAAAAARYEEALENLLEVVKTDPRHQDGAARKAMVVIFGLLGPGSDLARDYRRRLVLYL